jgi:hypothetical protein
MFRIESIPFASKSGWTVESIPMLKKQAEKLFRSRVANATGARRFRLVRISDGFATHGS